MFGRVSVVLELEYQGGEPLHSDTWEALRALEDAAAQADDIEVPVDDDVRRLLAVLQAIDGWEEEDWEPFRAGDGGDSEEELVELKMIHLLQELQVHKDL